MDKVYSNFKRSLPALIILALVALLHKPLEMLLDATVVRIALSYIDSEWYVDFIVFGAALFIIVRTVMQLRKHYIPNNTLSLLLVGLAIYYTFYRFSNEQWEFTPFSFCSGLYYADIVFVGSAAAFSLWFSMNMQSPPNDANGFFNDEPLKSDGNDLLGHRAYAEDLVAKLKSGWFETSFAVGINGKWGIGKTSFVNILRSYMKEDKSIIEIEFNPWRSNSPDAIVKDFFVAFSNALSPYHSGITRLASVYLQRMSDVSGESLFNPLTLASDLIHNPKAIGDLHQDINGALKSIGRKVVVYIDDVDRLDNDEVFEVLRLIRNTANFRNTLFVVAYDRDYLVSAINSKIDCKGRQYVEKIFQLEINLPYFESKVYRNKLAENLKNYISEEDYTWIRGDRTGRFTYGHKFPVEWFRSMRDVARITNAIILNYGSLKGEVVFEEYFKLEQLRVKYPSVYELLSRQTDRFLETMAFSASDDFYFYRLRKKSFLPEAGDDLTILEDYVNRNRKELSFNYSDISTILGVVNSVFESNDFLSPSKRNRLSVVYPSKFSRYFAYRLFDGALSSIEFSKARSSSQIEFNSKLSTWVIAGMEEALSEEFLVIKDYDNRDDFEKVIRAIFHLASCESIEKDNRPWMNLVTYNLEDLSKKLTNNDVLLNLYSVEDSKNADFINFVNGLFVNAKSPFIFEASYIQHLNRLKPTSFPIDEAFREETVLRYLSEYCSASDTFKTEVFQALLGCCEIAQDNNSDPKYIDGVYGVVITSVDKNLDNFLSAFVYFQTRDKAYGVYPFVRDAYNSWNDFEEFFNSKDEGSYKYLQRFKLFFKEYKANKYNLVPFDFGDMPIDR